MPEVRAPAVRPPEQLSVRGGGLPVPRLLRRTDRIVTMPKEWICHVWTLSEDWCHPGDPHPECTEPNGYVGMTDFDYEDDLREWEYQSIWDAVYNQERYPWLRTESWFRCGTRSFPTKAKP